jgi:hypothetical protein
MKATKEQLAKAIFNAFNKLEGEEYVRDFAEDRRDKEELRSVVIDGRFDLLEIAASILSELESK